MHKKLMLLFLPLLFLIGCTTQRYGWYGYDDKLYAYYKNPNEKEKFIERLKEVILRAEQNGNIPPGMYAEYGYLCFEGQNYKDAIAYFEKERNLWPESQIFMNKMIDNAQKMLYKNQNKGQE